MYLGFPFLRKRQSLFPPIRNVSLTKNVLIPQKYVTVKFKCLMLCFSHKFCVFIPWPVIWYLSIGLNAFCSCASKNLKANSVTSLYIMSCTIVATKPLFFGIWKCTDMCLYRCVPLFFHTYLQWTYFWFVSVCPFINFSLL